MNKREQDYKKIAEEYSEVYGYALKKQAEEIESQRLYEITPRLDGKVKDFTQEKKRRKGFRNLGLIAAAVLIIAVAPLLINTLKDSSPLESAGESAAISVESKGEPSSALAEESSEEEPKKDQAIEYELIPLAFSLPETLSQVDVTLDRGKSVYEFESSLSDDIVLTLEKSDDSEFSPELVPLTINNVEAFGYSNADYNLITFDKDDIRYTMTCQYDINTLVDFSEYILI